MADNQSADIVPLVSRTAARSAFGAALSLFVGRGRRYSVKQLSNATGVKDRVIECAKCDPEGGDYREPELAAILSIAKFLGPEFTTEWLKEAGQGAFWLPETEDTPPGAMAADACEDAAAIARRVADGALDQKDVIELRPHGRRMMAQGARLAFG